MRTTFKLVTWGALVLTLLLANVRLADAHNWWYWHWDRSNMRIAIWNYETEAEAARADWSSHTHLALPRSSTHTDISAFGGNYGATGWSGLATIEGWGLDWPWNCGGAIWCKITHAHARYNAFYGGQSGAGANSDIRGILCQEIGHTWGLGHSDTGDCMGKTYWNQINVTGPHNWSDVNARY